MHVPGLKVVIPATPADAKGLLKTAIRDDNPVLFLENKQLWRLKGPVPDDTYLIPLGKADLKREGKDITLVTYSAMVHKSLAAAKELEKEGVDVEVLDLRTLTPLDREAVLNSVKKNHRLIIVEEDCKTGGVGAEISALVAEQALDYLDAPILRVAGLDSPIPSSPPLERAIIPDEKRIMAAVRESLS